jgi:CelD/BcsL family acetyltransferase involved in cellulose biosynthesis
VVSNPFLTAEWIESWQRRFPAPHAVILERSVAGRFDLAADFIVSTERHRGLPVRVMRLTGGQDTPYKAPLVAGDADAATAAFVEWLKHDAPRADMVVLDGLEAEAGWAARIAAECRRQRLAVRPGVPIPTPYIALPQTYAELQARLKKSLRRNIQRRRNQAADRGVTLERVTGTAVGREHVFAAASIEGRSWKGSRGAGVFHDEAHVEFHLDLAARTDLPFDLDYVFLIHEGVAVAFQYGFIHRGTYFAYNTSYDEAFHDMSPGLVVMDALLQELIASGIRRCDLLVGDGAYKRDWTADAAAVESIAIYGRTLRGSVARAIDHAVLRIKRARAMITDVKTTASR